MKKIGGVLSHHKVCPSEEFVLNSNDLGSDCLSDDGQFHPVTVLVTAVRQVPIYLFI